MIRMAMTALALTVGAAMLPSPAKASECYGIRDASKRQECLAVERGAPEDCLGVRDPDQRVLCRQRAEQERRFRGR